MGIGLSNKMDNGVIDKIHKTRCEQGWRKEQIWERNSSFFGSMKMSVGHLSGDINE